MDYCFFWHFLSEERIERHVFWARPLKIAPDTTFLTFFYQDAAFFGCVFFISSWRVTLHKTSFFLEDNTFVNYLKKRLMLLILMEETMMVQGKAYTLSFKEPLKYSLFISAVFRCRLVIHRRFKKGRSGLWTVSMNNTQASKKKGRGQLWYAHWTFLKV